jgi:hypothetical protein
MKTTRRAPGMKKPGGTLTKEIGGSNEESWSRRRHILRIRRVCHAFLFWLVANNVRE